jgi:hypothetical protein
MKQENKGPLGFTVEEYYVSAVSLDQLLNVLWCCSLLAMEYCCEFKDADNMYSRARDLESTAQCSDNII